MGRLSQSVLRQWAPPPLTLQFTMIFALNLSSIGALSCRRRCFLAPANALRCEFDIHHAVTRFPHRPQFPWHLGLQGAGQHCVIAWEFKLLCSTVATQMMMLSSGLCAQRNSTSSSYATGVASACKVAAGPRQATSLHQAYNKLTTSSSVIHQPEEGRF